MLSPWVTKELSSYSLKGGAIPGMPNKEPPPAKGCQVPTSDVKVYADTCAMLVVESSRASRERRVVRSFMEMRVSLYSLR